MTTIYISNAIRSHYTSAERIIELINTAPITEGIERIEFSAEQLAGQFAAQGYVESGEGEYRPATSDDIEAYLDGLRDDGAQFHYPTAIEHGLKVAAAMLESDE
ncbi:hypothetical protein CEK28_08505 [Xenophilus sp. AP218F]|nr:hypothetical protein CEK28_08505 [Xenophilus sp. AP218F]